MECASIVVCLRSKCLWSAESSRVLAVFAVFAGRRVSPILNLPRRFSFPFALHFLSRSTMLLQALRHSFLLSITLTVLTTTATPYPVNCGDAPTRVRRGYLDKLPVGALPAATPLFVAPAAPLLLPIESVASLIGSFFIDLLEICIDTRDDPQGRPILSPTSASLLLRALSSHLLVRDS